MRAGKKNKNSIIHSRAPAQTYYFSFFQLLVVVVDAFSLSLTNFPIFGLARVIVVQLRSVYCEMAVEGERESVCIGYVISISI